MDLQESHLRGTEVNSEDPLHISIRSNDSLPSFVAAPGVMEAEAEQRRDAELDGIDHWDVGGIGGDDMSHGTTGSLAAFDTDERYQGVCHRVTTSGTL